jgi:hypothetical protein
MRPKVKVRRKNLSTNLTNLTNEAVGMVLVLSIAVRAAGALKALPQRTRRSAEVRGATALLLRELRAPLRSPR